MPVAGGNLAIADFAWHTMARLLASAGSARFERIRREAGKAAGEGAGMDFASLILGRPAEAVLEIVHGLVIQEVAKILGTGADRIDPLRPLNDLGMDSLMGVELALGLEGRFGIRLPAMLLNEGPTAARVAQRITEKIMNGQAEEELDDGGNLRASINALAGKHGETLSDEEVSQAATELRAHLKQARG
jgi:acyl carrier protein